MLEEGQVKMQSRLEEEEEAKEVYCNLKPEDKLSHVTSVSRDTKTFGLGNSQLDEPIFNFIAGGLIMVGGGINDAPKTCLAIRGIGKQNVALALSSIFLASLTSVLGFLPLWLTILLHEGGTLLVCLNSIRALNDPTWSWRQNLVDMVDKFKSVIMFRRRHKTTKYH
ncbi:hypothetical protein LOK49_LG06G01128 [Camellia lanceoleosa]|uniref:Uncharacterized protein n=1 Tax=Camellia lanceoleosa TaxID=1840588 RepID=A0ACC0HFG7_9ERIC|nr:hypothetical protein LOK49_LG06G01128 [Camellia lanceoleosa]